MRQLARGKTKDECLASVERMKKNGFKPITDVKEDNSLYFTGGDISYVVVMELKDDGTHKNKNHRWNNPIPRIR